MNVSEPEMTSVTDLTDNEFAMKWNETEWAEVETIVNNLQVRIASAAKKQRNLFQADTRKGRSGSSWMKRKFHVQFREDGAGAIPPCYSTLSNTGSN